LSIARDARRALREGPAAIAERQRARLAAIVAYARAHSPYYRDLYRKLPAHVDDPTLLPVTDKKLLMARFDDWVTDREVTRDRVEELVADPDLVGERFLGRYLVATTSGTSGVRGLPCGSPLPAIRVQGRAADVLTFPGVHGEQVSLSPMLVGTLLDRVPGVEQFQVVQTAPTTLRVRLQPGDDRVWHAVHDGIDRLLTDSKAEHVTVERAEEPPQPAPSGKYRRVVPFSA
jgi:phenylacetate-coenzyme A ligase PaaK-like adenylate-forming protein